MNSLQTRKRRVCDLLEEQLVKLKHDRIASPDEHQPTDQQILAISGLDVVTADSDLEFLLSEGQDSCTKSIPSLIRPKK